jgi:hypothetical protein
MCGAELEAGELVPLVPDYQLDAVEIHASIPQAVGHLSKSERLPIISPPNWSRRMVVH